MAITTLNGVISGLQPLQAISKAFLTGTLVSGRPQSAWAAAGQPAAGSFNTTINGNTYSSSSALVTGQIPHFDPPGGTSAYLARFQHSWSQSTGVLILCDRIWDNRININDTTSQAITTPAWPTRDVNGSLNGDGILLAIEVNANTSATAAVLTAVTYTNQAGTGSRTCNFIDTPTSTASIAGNFFRLSLQGTDTGVRSVQSIQFSTAWTTGTISLVAYRVLLTLDSTVFTSNAVDALTGCMPQIFNGTVPFMVVIPSGTSGPAIIGHYIESHG